MKILRRFLRIILFLFILLNIAVAFHAYRFTHFYNGPESKSIRPEEMKWADKLEYIVFGIKHPKSKIGSVPSTPFETVILNTSDNLKLEGWFCKNSSGIGTVILFHGHGSSKSSVIPEAEFFYSLGFNTLSFDFRAHGNSEGNITTIGYKEAEDVKLAYDYCKERGDQNIVLWGRSLGAATITRAISKYRIAPKKVILEMSFGSLQDAIKSRIRLPSLPEQPTATLLTFWGVLNTDFGHSIITHATMLRKLPALC
jgi:pimeloyl-ACP methyl ester carboxylesterase